MSIRKMKKSWWIDFRFDHIRYRKRSPDNSKAGAQAYEALLRQKLARGESIDRIETLDTKLPDFKEFAWKWFEVYAKANNKRSEIKNKEIALRVHLVPFFGKTRIDKISGLQVEEYKAEKVKSKRLVNKTINNHLTIFAKCMLNAQEWLDLNKIPKIKKLVVPPQKFDFLTVEESKTLLEHSGGIWHDLFLVALKTGLRHGELLALSWEDINWKNNQITIRRSMYKDEITSTKSNRIRYIDMIDDVIRCLYPQRKQRGFIFRDEKDKYFTRWRIKDTLEQICRKANMRRITCHVLRHTFASHLAMAGATIQSIQQLLGHSDIQTTMRYAHLNQSALKSTIDLLASDSNKNNSGQPVGNQAIKFDDILQSIAANHPNTLANHKQKQPQLEL